MTDFQYVSADVHFVALDFVHIFGVYEIAAVTAQKAAALQFLFRLGQRAASLYRFVHESVRDFMPHYLHVYEFVRGYAAKAAVYGNKHGFHFFCSCHVYRLFEFERKVRIVHGLDYEVERVHLVTFLRVLRHFGDENYGHAIVLTAQCARRIQAAYARQIDIHKHYGKIGVLIRLQKFFRASVPCDFKFYLFILTVPVQIFGQHVGFTIVVFDQGNFHSTFPPLPLFVKV